MFQEFPFKTPSLHFGHGAISMLGKEARKLEGQRIFLITGPSVKKAGILDKALASLKESSLDVEVNVQGRDTPEPGTRIVEETSRMAREGHFDVIVGLGGGSILDVAKMASALASLPDIGMTDRSKIPRWAVEAHAERRLLGRCVRNLTVLDIEKIYARAFEPR